MDDRVQAREGTVGTSYPRSMRQQLPKLLFLSGTATLVVGIVLTATLVVLRSGCTSEAARSQGDLASASASCQGYTPFIHWSFLLLALAAVLVVGAALSGTITARRGRDPSDSTG